MTDRGSDTAAAPDQETLPHSYSCPSAPAAPGVGVLGLLGPDGKIHNLRTPLTADAAFLSAASAEGPAEARMRFTARCQTGACSQWTGTRCGVIDRAMAHLAAMGPAPDAGPLPPCTIRGDCRWFAQRGPAACGTCAYIVTDTRGLQDARSDAPPDAP